MCLLYCQLHSSVIHHVETRFRSSAQKESKFSLNILNDNKKMNAYKGNDTPNRILRGNGEKQQEMDRIDEMFNMIKEFS